MLGLLKKKKDEYFNWKNSIDRKAKNAVINATNKTVSLLNSKLPDPNETAGKWMSNAPKLDVAQKVKNPVLRFGATLGEDFVNIPSKMIRNFGQTARESNSGELFTGKGLRQFAGRTGENALDILTLGKGKAIYQIGRTVFKKGIPYVIYQAKQGVKQGFKTGGVVGTGYGVAQEAQKDKTSLRDMVTTGVTSGVIGALAGGLFGGALSGAGSIRSAWKADRAEGMSARDILGSVGERQPVGLSMGRIGNREVLDNLEKHLDTVRRSDEIRGGNLDKWIEIDNLHKYIQKNKNRIPEKEVYSLMEKTNKAIELQSKMRERSQMAREARNKAELFADRERIQEQKAQTASKNVSMEDLINRGRSYYSKDSNTSKMIGALGKSLPRFGMNIEDVSGGKPTVFRNSLQRKNSIAREDIKAKLKAETPQVIQSNRVSINEALSPSGRIKTLQGDIKDIKNELYDGLENDYPDEYSILTSRLRSKESELADIINKKNTQPLISIKPKQEVKKVYDEVIQAGSSQGIKIENDFAYYDSLPKESKGSRKTVKIIGANPSPNDMIIRTDKGNFQRNSQTSYKKVPVKVITEGSGITRRYAVLDKTGELLDSYDGSLSKNEVINLLKRKGATFLDEKLNTGEPLPILQTPEQQPLLPIKPETQGLQYENVPLKDVISDTKYQPRIDTFSEATAKRIQNEGYNPQEFLRQPFEVLEKDGKYYVLSGHSRTEGLRRLGENAPESVPAVVHRNISDDEAFMIASKGNQASTMQTAMDNAKSIFEARSKGLQTPVQKGNLIKGYNEEDYARSWEIMNSDGTLFRAIKQGAIPESDVLYFSREGNKIGLKPETIKNIAKGIYDREGTIPKEAFTRRAKIIKKIMDIAQEKNMNLSLFSPDQLSKVETTTLNNIEMLVTQLQKKQMEARKLERAFTLVQKNSKLTDEQIALLENNKQSQTNITKEIGDILYKNVDTMAKQQSVFDAPKQEGGLFSPQPAPAPVQKPILGLLPPGRFLSVKDVKNSFKKNKRSNEFINLLKPNKNTILPRPNVDEMPRKTIEDVENLVYGNTAGITQQGTREGVGMTGNLLRKGENLVDEGVSRLLSSDNILARTLGNTLRAFGGTFGKAEALQQAGAKYRGGIDYGQKLAQDLRKILPQDPKSLERIHSNLDPDLYGGKVEALTPEEVKSAEALRIVSDYINDTNYKNGFISEETWLSNRGGKYITRAYEPYDMPPEVADFVKQANAKFDLNPFKQRKEIDDWKMENAIKDPGYLAGKRLQQTEFNNSVKQMFDWLKDKPAYISDVPKGGYVQVSDHKAYGDVAGKFVRKDVMEMVKGMYFEHDILQKGYDILSWYDRNPLRRVLKQTKTLYNPAVRLGNNIGNYVFSWLGGINPFSFTKNQAWASQALKQNDPLALQLFKDGILGTGTHKGDIVQMASELAKGQDKSTIQKIKEVVENSYGFVDDRAKLAGVKTFLDRGYSYQEATRRASRMFQNYQTVGFLYDIGSKLPVFGNAFVRFQGSLASIIKSSAVDHPMRLVGTVMALKFLGDASSIANGESPQDKETRENRVGAPRIPFTDISLEFQTPWGAVNVSRMLGIYANTPVGGESIGSDLSKMSPINIDINNPARSLGNDVLIGPVISTAIDTDFRGKSVADPDKNKYMDSSLTTSEKNINRAKFLGRSYNLPFGNDLINVYNASQGKPDFYGRERSVPQALARLGGIKVEEFGADQALAQRTKDAQFDQYARDEAKKKINFVMKQLANGEIDSITAQKRIDTIKKDTPIIDGIPTANAQAPMENGKFSSQIIENPNGGFSYVNEDGDLKTVKTQKLAEIALQKQEFSQSGENFRDLGDVVLRKNVDGSVRSQRKTEFTDDLLTKRMNMAKDEKDYATWLEYADQKYTNLENMLNDDTIDELEKLNIEDKMNTLARDIAKYQGYGGNFTKGRSGGSGGSASKENPYKNVYSFDATLQSPKYKVPRRVGVSPAKSFGGRGRRTRITRIRRKI